MNLPPGPKALPELIKMLFQRKRHPIKLYEGIFKKYGNVVYFKLGPYRFVMLNSADAINEVLQSDSKNYTKSTGYERFKLIVGNGLLVSEDEIWKKQRKLLSGVFTSNNIEKFYPVMVAETLNMLKRWKSNKEVDLAEEMNLVTLQIISISLFGKDQIINSKRVRTSLQEMLSYLQTIRHLWIQLLLFPFPIKNKRAKALVIEKSLPFKSTRKFFNAIHEIDYLVNGMIEERMNRSQKVNLLDKLILATDSEDQSQMDKKQLRDEVVNLLIAGHETTANALTWTWLQILKYPEVQKKVREEVNSVVIGEVPSYEDLTQLVYLKATFEESMRLFPPFWRISRKNEISTKINDFDIPEGTNVIASIYTLHRNHEYWEDPLNFKPERFINQNQVKKNTYIPFGAGPRACIGAQFATIEALTVLAICIKNTEMTLLSPKDPSYFMSLTLQPKEGCKVSFKRDLKV